MDQYVKLAKNTIETYIRDRKIYRPAEDELTDEMMNSRAGAFVSIHEEIIANAISASTRDPRFPAIRAGELPFLEINVDVLGEPEDISSMDELDVKRYGVIVTKGRRRGLLLPDLEGVDTVEYQVRIARMKAGIRDEEEGVQLSRFEVIRHT